MYLFLPPPVLWGRGQECARRQTLWPRPVLTRQAGVHTMRAMRNEAGFLRIGRWILQLILVGVICASGCDRKTASKKSAAESTIKSPRVVSLVPGASDIIVGIGAGDHLVAVSNYDTDPRTANLPRVGDYLLTDWERIAPLHPQAVVTQYAAGRTPAGFTQRLQAMGATQVNISVDRLSDIYATIIQLGDACGEHEKGIAARKALEEQINAIHLRVARDPPVPALIVLGPDGTSIAGQGTFFDDLLTAAGGSNVAAGKGRYPTLDREQLVLLQPQVIIQLLPSAGPQVIQQAANVWTSLPQIPAVKNGRVVRLTEWYVMHSGYEVGKLAERFAQILHPDATTQPIVQPPTTSASGTQPH